MYIFYIDLVGLCQIFQNNPCAIIGTTGQVQKLELGHALHLGRVDDLQDIAGQVQSLQGSGQEERCLEKTTVGAIRLGVLV